MNRIPVISVVLMLAIFTFISLPGQAQTLPPKNLRQIQVSPKTFTAGEFLKPGMYNVWVRIGEYAPGRIPGTSKVEPHRGGTWKKYSRIDFSNGGKTRHVTVFPDMVQKDSIGYTDFANPQYRTPAANEFILHIDNRSLTQAVTYVFQRLSDSGTNKHPETGTLNVSGRWVVVFKGVDRLDMTLQHSGTTVTGTLVTTDNSGSRVKGRLDGTTLTLSRDTGLDTVQHYKVTVEGTRFTGTFWNVGKYPDSGTFTGEMR